MTQTELETMVVRLVGDGSSYQKMCAESAKATDDVAEHVRFSTKRIEAFGIGLKGYGANAVAALTPLLGIGAGLSSVFRGVKLSADMEQLEISFKTLTGSAAVSKETLADLTKFAADTPFQMPEVVTAAKQMIAFGAEAKGIVGTMTILGDVASGLGIPLGELTYLYGTLKSQGRAFTVDINQFAMRGIPIWDELGKQFGKSNAEMREMVEKGKVGFADVEKAFKSMTGAGGRFHDLMKDQSKSLTGLYSTMKDDIEAVLRKIGDITIENLRLKEAVAGVSEGAKKLGENLNALPQWFITLGGSVAALVLAVGGLSVGWKVFGGVLLAGYAAIRAIPSAVIAAGASLYQFAFAGGAAAASARTLYSAELAVVLAQAEVVAAMSGSTAATMNAAAAKNVLTASEARLVVAQTAATAATNARTASVDRMSAALKVLSVLAVAYAGYEFGSSFSQFTSADAGGLKARSEGRTADSGGMFSGGNAYADYAKLAEQTQKFGELQQRSVSTTIGLYERQLKTINDITASMSRADKEKTWNDAIAVGERNLQGLSSALSGANQKLQEMDTWMARNGFKDNGLEAQKQQVKDISTSLEQAKKFQKDLEDGRSKAVGDKANEGMLAEVKKLTEEYKKQKETMGMTSGQTRVYDLEKQGMKERIALYDGYRAKVEEAEKAFDDASSKGLPTADKRARLDEVEKLAAGMKKEIESYDALKSAVKAVDDAEKNRKKADELLAEQKRKSDSVKETIDNLKREAEVYGLSAAEKEVYLVSKNGATEAQQEEIRGLVLLSEQTKKYEENAKKAKTAAERFDAALSGSAESRSRMYEYSQSLRNFTSATGKFGPAVGRAGSIRDEAGRGDRSPTSPGIFGNNANIKPITDPLERMADTLDRIENKGGVNLVPAEIG